MKDKAAIAGIGETEYSKNSGMSELALFLQATERAAADAGVSLKDIDGIIVSKGFGPAVKEVVTNLGLKELYYQRSQSDIFKSLKFEGQQGGQFLLVFSLRFNKTVHDCLLEVFKGLVISGVQTLFLDELPQPFNQIQVG